jgi:hypothetical protein
MEFARTAARWKRLMTPTIPLEEIIPSCSIFW